jgi:hypothetical protein
MSAGEKMAQLSADTQITGTAAGHRHKAAPNTEIIETMLTESVTFTTAESQKRKPGIEQ